MGGGQQWSDHAWSDDCEFDAVSGAGYFAQVSPIALGRTYSLSLISGDGPGQNAPHYSFFIYVLPWISRVGISAMPAYVLDKLPDSKGNELLTRAYAEMNRQVAPNTSLFFALDLPRETNSTLEWIEKNTRIVLVEIAERNAELAVAPLRSEPTCRLAKSGSSTTRPPAATRTVLF